MHMEILYGKKMYGNFLIDHRVILNMPEDAHDALPTKSLIKKSRYKRTCIYMHVQKVCDDVGQCTQYYN